MGSLPRLCTVEGCGNKHLAQGFCPKHYYHHRISGAFSKVDNEPESRFWAKVDKNGPVHPELKTPCWLWTASVSPKGYGYFKWNGKVGRVHRFAYLTFKGQIPDGLEVDHLCEVRHCVNPDHLQLLTHEENLLKSSNIVAINARKTHCPKGHPYDRMNSRGFRSCLTCLRESRRLRKKRAKARKAAMKLLKNG
jgi:hypothetical protein